MPGALRPLEGRARWAVIALSAVIVTDILSIGSDWLEIRLMDRVLEGEAVSNSSLGSDDTRQLVVEVILLVFYVAAAVLFLRWFYRAYSNLPALGSELRFKRGWAIAGWFIPILWLWRPKQIANDIWRGSDPSVRAVHLHITKTSVTPLLSVWWAAWIITGIVSFSAARLWWDAPIAADAGVSAALGITSDAEDLRSTAVFDLVSSGIDIVAAVLAILVVRTLTSRQLERERVVATLPETLAPAT